MHSAVRPRCRLLAADAYVPSPKCVKGGTKYRIRPLLGRAQKYQVPERGWSTVPGMSDPYQRSRCKTADSGKRTKLGGYIAIMYKTT